MYFNFSATLPEDYEFCWCVDVTLLISKLFYFLPTPGQTKLKDDCLTKETNYNLYTVIPVS